MQNNNIIIGNYKDTSGWGQACFMYMKAFDLYNIPFTSRSIKYGYYDNDIPESILKYEKTYYSKYKNIIQIVLPHALDNIPNFYNIGIIFLETPSLVNINNPFCTWTERILNMDEIWVSTQHELQILKDRGINAYFIPQPCDLNDYNIPYKKFAASPEGYNFYYIGGLEDT